MMNKLIFLFGLLWIVSCSQQKAFKNAENAAEIHIAENEIREFQEELLSEWNNPETTPLKEEEKVDFQGIHFFSVDLKFRILADFTPIIDGKSIPFPTSANKIKYFKPYGTAQFALEGKNYELTLYQSDPPYEEAPEHLFLPFMDETNGETSYGGGRYMDLTISDIQDGKILLDFNQAYNPYCAYSNYYNCPIPPSNNYLEIEINAGVSFKQ